MAYATVADLEARWRELTDAEETQAETMLSDAALIIDAFTTIDPDDADALARAKYVSCAMVERAMMAAASDGFGVTNMSATMGPFTQQVTYANPNGEAKDFFEVWETAQVQPFPVRPVNELAQDFLNNTEMLEKLISMSPGLSREYILEMLQKAQGKIT